MCPLLWGQQIHAIDVFPRASLETPTVPGGEWNGPMSVSWKQTLEAGGVLTTIDVACFPGQRSAALVPASLEGGPAARHRSDQKAPIRGRKREKGEWGKRRDAGRRSHLEMIEKSHRSGGVVRPSWGLIFLPAKRAGRNISDPPILYMGKAGRDTVSLERVRRYGHASHGKLSTKKNKSMGNQHGKRRLQIRVLPHLPRKRG